ncbi:MAG: hypothetical protein UC961_10820 [Emergencia sp.]|nr:hypothetical protein [Emergencia sp.]
MNLENLFTDFTAEDIIVLLKIVLLKTICKKRKQQADRLRSDMGAVRRSAVKEKNAENWSGLWS